MNKLVLLFLLVTSLAVRGQNLCDTSLDVATIPPGPIVVNAHDPLYGTDVNYDLIADTCMSQMNAFFVGSSYGRNSFVFNITPDYVVGLCGGYNAGNGVIELNIKQGDAGCVNGGLGWYFPVMMHEMGHFVGKWGEGSAWNGTQVISYGDIYDIMGHGSRQFNAAYKDFGGLLGPDSPRVLTCVETSGDYYITDAETMSEGVKALKVMHAQRDIIFVGKIVSSRKEYFYLEMRNNLLTGLVSSGKGKHRTTTTGHGPGVLARTGGRTVWPNSGSNISIEELLWTNLGYNGTLTAGSGYSYTAPITSIDATPIPPAPAITNTITKSISFTVLAVDSLGAKIHVQIN